MAQKQWEEYEDVTQHLLDRFRGAFGLSRVEGKQKVSGESTTIWELDAKGVREEETGVAVFVVECRRRQSRMKQEAMAALVFRIRDVGAEGGLVVAPIPPQEGAKRIAAHNGVRHVLLARDSTRTEYQMKFLDKLFIGRCDGVDVSDGVRGWQEVIATGERKQIL